MTLAGLVAGAYMEHRADAVFVDGGGVGGGVVDRLRQLGVPCVDVQFGAKSDNNFGGAESGIQYANKRAEIWGTCRAWLAGGAIPDDSEFIAGLTGPEYGYNANNAIQLESKADMKKRGISSPDMADALCLTFAYPVVPKAVRGNPDPAGQYKSEYDPFNEVAA